MTFHISVVLVAAAFCQTTAERAEDGPAKDVPELQALSHYIGNWDIVITSKESPFAKGGATTKWILDGRFVQQTGSLASSDGATTLKVTTLMTYDRDQKAYRMWSYFSDGTTSESSGRWDAKTRTMTSIRRRDDTTTTTTAKFGEKGSEEWEIVTTNQNHDVIGKFAGTNTRRKK